MRRVALALLVYVSWSCDAPAAPGFPAESLTPFSPLPRYALWWSEVESCAGRAADFSSVQWLRTLGDPIVVNGGEYAGFWWRDGNRIALVNPYYGPTVRHEMLHAILNRGDHPVTVFAGSCDGVVRFDAPELPSVPPALIAAAETMTAARALSIAVGATPAAPRIRDYEGWFTVVVTATNHAGRPVWIEVPSDYAGSFFFMEDGQIGTLLWTKAKRVFFGPGQQRRVLLDAYVDAPGTYHLRGEYLGAYSPWTAVTVSP